MKLQKALSIEAKTVEDPQAKSVTMRMLVGPDDGAPNFNMRLFEVAPGGWTPRHKHDWEHEVYVLKGSGTVFADGKENSLSAGDCIFIPPNDEHQFVNTGDESLMFLCIVPQKQPQK